MRRKRLYWVVLALLIVGSESAVTSVESAIDDAIGTSHFGLMHTDWSPPFPGAWVRPHPGPFIWDLIERTPGVYDWTETDLLVEKQQGRQLAILATVWPFAAWDQAQCHTLQPRARGQFGEFPDWMYLPCDMDGYLTWLTAMVERYDGDGVDDMPGLLYPIRHWEILNEPEMQGPELCFFQEGPQAYGELLTRSYAAVKSADAEAIVLPAGQSGMHPEATAYWVPILEDSTIPFDLGNIHSIRASDIQQDAAYWAPEYVDMLQAAGRTGLPYWITETETGSVDPRSQRDEVDEARDLFVGTITAFLEGAEVVFHGVAVDPRGMKKLQLKLTTFTMLGTEIGTFSTAARLSNSSAQFVMPNGDRVYALWDGARLPSHVTGLVQVLTYLDERRESDAREVVADVPLIVRTLPGS